MYYDFAEQFTEWARPHDQYELDELPLLFFSCAIACLIFSWRRSHEMKVEYGLRLKAEHKTLEAKSMLQSLFDSGISGNFAADAHGQLLMCNEAFKNILRIEDIKSINLYTLIPEIIDHDFISIQENKCVNYDQIELSRRDESKCYVNARLLFVPKQGNDMASIYGFLVDITAEYLAQKQLNKLYVDNQQLARHVLTVQEEERKSVARELHDDMGQYITAISLEAAALVSESNHKDQAKRILSNAKHIHKSVKSIIKRLRPPALDGLGLSEAIEHLIRDFQVLQNKLICHFNTSSYLPPIPEEHAVIGYRLVQEGLTNIAKYAQASEVFINLIYKDLPGKNGQLILEIRDNGIGFDMEQVTTGFGLTGMRERIAIVKGKFQIITSKQHGVLIRAVLPIPDSLKPTHLEFENYAK